MKAEMRVVETLNCPSKLRLHIFLPGPELEALAAAFPEAEARLTAFSQTIPGARDHLQLSCEGAWVLGAAADSGRIVATFAQSEAGLAARDEVLARLREMLS